MRDAAQLTLAQRLERSASPRVILLLVLLCGATLLGSELLQGWFAYDEGALGQSAERALRGEIPHRDFDEIYTGLLTYLNAAVFAVTGAGMVAMRIVLFGASMAWLWATYRIALRFAPAAGAGVVALIAFVWAVPNYTAPMPSWYILFAATFGALALVRWHETGRDSWLVLAGVAGGIAFLFKLSGIFYFLGAGLALLAAGMPASRALDADTASPLVGWGIAAALVAMITVLALVAGAGDRELLRHVLPTAVLATAIAVFAVRGLDRHRLTGRTLLRHRLLPFAIGGLLPIAVFFAFYAAVGGLHEMLEGVFVTPFRRLSFAALRPPAVASLVFALPLLIFLWVPSDRGVRKWVVITLAALSFAAVFFISAHDSRLYQVGWLSAWGLLFFVAIDGARQVLVKSAARNGTSDTGRDASISLACVAVGLSLIEYPYAAPIYTLYALPLAMLATFAALRVRSRASVSFQLVLGGFFLTFGLFRIVPGTVSTLGHLYTPSQEIARLELERGGLRIDPYAAVVYERLIPVVKELGVDRRLWAGPDAPEVYFLSDLPNHTRSLFDFLDVESTNSVSFIDRLDSLNISLVVLKLQPPFSAAPTDDMRAALQERFPNVQAMPGFVLFWR